MAIRDDRAIDRDDAPAQSDQRVSLAGKQERVSPAHIVAGDLLMLPGVDAFPVLVERVLEAEAAGQQVVVRYTSDREADRARATIPWSKAVVRVGNIEDVVRSRLS